MVSHRTSSSLRLEIGFSVLFLDFSVASDFSLFRDRSPFLDSRIGSPRILESKKNFPIFSFAFPGLLSSAPHATAGQSSRAAKSVGPSVPTKSNVEFAGRSSPFERTVARLAATSSAGIRGGDRARVAHDGGRGRAHGAEFGAVAGYLPATRAGRFFGCNVALGSGRPLAYGQAVQRIAT